MRVAEILSTEEIPRLHELQTTLVPGQTFRGEWCSLRKDGSTFPAEVGLTLLRDGRILGIGRDISERKQAEAELRKSHAQLEMAAAASDIGEWEVDFRDRSASGSPQASKILGHESSLPQWSYELFLDHILPQHRAEVDEKMRAAELTGICDFETQIRRADGEGRWIWVRGRCLRDPEDRAPRMIGTVMDITNRKLAEEELRRKEERLRLAQRAAGMGVFEIDLALGKHTISPQMMEICGMAGATPPSDLMELLQFTRSDEKPLHEELRAAMWAGKATHFERRIVRPGGEVRWIEITGDGQFDVAGHAVRFLGVCRDVTERRQLEAQLRQSQKMQAVGQIAGGVAHDFNNVLGVILGNMELLSERLPGDEDLQRYFERIRRAVNSATSVTRQLLAFSRKQVLQPVVLNLNHVVEQLHKMIQRLIGEHIQVVVSLEPTLAAVKADPGQIEQMLLNLVVNARDAMPQGGRLLLETSNVSRDLALLDQQLESKPRRFAKLSVTDTGCGMTKVILDHLFEPFFTTKEVGKGTGLGLATVYGIVKQSNGHISVRSEPGVGTTFDIFFPSVNTQPVREPSPSSASFAWGSETILVVEDENALREIITLQLEKLGYRVLTAAHPEQALRLFGDHAKEVSLLLTDVLMPGMHGRELAKRLQVEKPSLKVLFVSGYTDDKILRHDGSDSRHALLLKPFNMETLAARVRETLDGRSLARKT